MNGELYSCSSTVLGDIPGRKSPDDEVRVYWFRVGPRPLVVADYCSWIVDYDKMDGNLQAWMRWVTDSYFSKAEVEMLARYVKNSLRWPSDYKIYGDTEGNQFHYCFDKVRESQTFPPTLHIKFMVTSTLSGDVCIGKYRQFYYSAHHKWIRLNQYPDCNLPFHVWGTIRIKSD